MVKVNGEQVDVAGKTIAQYLIENGFDLKRVAVMRNDEIVPKAECDTVVLCEDDTVEVVSFVGGG